jgi:hypothetical protein
VTHRADGFQETAFMSSDGNVTLDASTTQDINHED